jgi:hypothetical protein
MMTILLFVLITNAGFGQMKKYIPVNGFWELISSIHDKKTTVVQFYDNNSHLIYEEKIVGIEININREKTLKQLKKGLDKALLAYNEEKKPLYDKDWMAVLINKEK